MPLPYGSPIILAWPGSHVAATAVSPVSLSSLQLPTTVQCIQTPLDLPHNALLAADAVTAPILPAMWPATRDNLAT